MGKSYIICVDDEMIILRSLREQLELEFGGNYNIEIAESGEEALALIEEFLEAGEEIPLVISDYIMPGIKGDKLLEEIMNISPKTISILLTGQASMTGIKNALNNGGIFKYIPKPWERKDLYTAVHEALKVYHENERRLDKNKELKQANLLLAREAMESDEEIKKSTDALESLRKVSTVNRITEELSDAVGVSLKSIKSAIESIRTLRDNISDTDPASVEVYIKSVDSFYNDASYTINQLVSVFQSNMIKYLTEPADNIDVTKLLNNISLLNKTTVQSTDLLHNDKAQADMVPKMRIEKIAAWENEEMYLFNYDEILFFSKEENSTIVVTRGSGSIRVTRGKVNVNLWQCLLVFFPPYSNQSFRMGLYVYR
ncbi:response regulator [Acetivibrio cellulolyticus]|uniref:response regulator n=1 Tax=Acetivibrio cellulolyticus TaxID=35830 RepID=UPI0002481B3D|nr:response regulator [Acetivibrio cellulolyticus]